MLQTAESARRMSSYLWWYVRVQIVQFGVARYFTGRFGVAWSFIPWTALAGVREDGKERGLSVNPSGAPLPIQ